MFLSNTGSALSPSYSFWRRLAGLGSFLRETIRPNRSKYATVSRTLPFTVSIAGMYVLLDGKSDLETLATQSRFALLGHGVATHDPTIPSHAVYSVVCLSRPLHLDELHPLLASQGFRGVSLREILCALAKTHLVGVPTLIALGSPAVSGPTCFPIGRLTNGLWKGDTLTLSPLARLPAGQHLLVAHTGPQLWP